MVKPAWLPMALTLQDLHVAAFGASLKDLQDVALANMV